MMPTEPENLDAEPETFEPLGAVVDRVMEKLLARMAEADRQSLTGYVKTEVSHD